MNITEYRKEVQKAAEKAGPRLFKVFFIYLAILAVLSFLSYLLQSPYFDWQVRLMEYMQAGNHELPPLSSRIVWGVLLSWLLAMVSRIITFGWIRIALRISRHEAFDASGITEAFAYWWKVIFITLVTRILSLAACCLFLAPGIILFYDWRLSLQILADHPDYSPIQCMKQSRRLMRGERVNLVRLDAGCIVLYALAAIVYYFTSGIVRLWRVPSLALLHAAFYNHMCWWKPPEEPEEGGQTE